jgi:methionyl-tRNA formyltransferase
MKIIFAGTPEFAVPSLQMLLDNKHDVCAVYTQPDRPAGRGRKLHISPVKELALRANIPVFQPDSLKNTSDFNQLADLQADLLIVVAYGMILPQAVLDLFPYGCLNVHASLLPRWRGAAPIQRSIMAGDKKTGVTIMQIVLKLDAGAMLHKEECIIEEQDAASDLHDKLSVLGAIGLAKSLVQVKNHTVHAEPQDESQVTYAEKLTKQEALIDWSQSAETIALKVRGLNPWPVAHTLYRGQALKIWQAQAIPSNIQEEPGTVSATQKIMEVATGRGWLRVLEVQLPGGKRLPIQAFLNAHPVNDDKLG